MEGNNRIFERVRSSLNQNNKNLSPEDLEVAKCIFAALVTGIASENRGDTYYTAFKLLKVATDLGFVKNPPHSV